MLIITQFTLNHATEGGGVPSTSNWTNTVWPSVPETFSQGLPGNLTSVPFGCKGVESLSQVCNKISHWLKTGR